MERYAVFEIYRAASVRLIEVAAIELEASTGTHGCLVSARVDPKALIVCTGGDVKAFDLGAEPAPLDRLRQLVPDLDARLRDIVARGQL